MSADPSSQVASGRTVSRWSNARRIIELEAQLEESLEALRAIGRGDFDAVLTKDAFAERRLYTLQNADQPYRVLIEQIQEGAIMLGLDGTVLYCNRRLADMIAVSQERLIGRKLQPFICQRDLAAFAHLVESALQGPTRGECSMCLPSGSEIPVVLSLSLLPNDDGQPRLCGVVADLTEQKRQLQELSETNGRLAAALQQREVIEATLRQSQKMEAVGQLTGGLAHDFNNLLAVVIGNLELMQGDIGEAMFADLEDHVIAALMAARRGAAVTHRLLAFSRQQTLAPKRLNPNLLIDGMADLLRRTVGPALSVETVLAGDAGAIFCDPNQLENALLNLAINARDAAPEGGRLTIATADVVLGEADAPDALAAGRYVTLSVTDTGSGMAPSIVARAFDPFFTTKPLGQGTGLGLSMIYGFAKQSGGEARIQSAIGVGTVVTLYLPHHGEFLDDADDCEPSPQRAASDPLPLAGAGESLLVVDDEPAVRHLLVRSLRRLGYEVIDVGDGKSGLDCVRSDQRIDLLVTDLGLPGGMSGRQLAAAARAVRPGLKVLFITGFEEDAGGNAMLEADTRIMTKPFSADALAINVQSMIGCTGG